MGGRFENFTPPTLGSELTASEITMLEEITALSNSSSGQFIRKESGSLVNSTLSETIALANLSDVAISGPASGHVLSYNGSSWVNATLSETITLANLSDVAILAPAHNQILSYDVATSSWKNKDITNLATTSINGDFTSAQLIVTASTGTDFTITTAGGTTTVAIPSASATARGLITTGAQAITGIKNFINNTDSASVQVGIFEGDRATIADGDEGYLTFRLSDSAGNQDEGARITWKATTVLTGATQDTDLIFSALVNNSLTTMLTLDGSASEIVPAVAINSAAAITGTAITGTSFVIGANTLTTTEWAFLDGQDQSVFTTSSPSFAGLTVAAASGIALTVDTTASSNFVVGEVTGFTTYVGVGLNGSLALGGAAAAQVNFFSSAADNILYINSGNAANISIRINNVERMAILAATATISFAAALDINNTLDIDSGTGANALDSTATTSDLLTITGSSLTTGDLLRLYSNSADVSSRFILELVNDNAASAGTVCLRLQQDANTSGIEVYMNGNGLSFYTDSLNTTQNVGEWNASSLSTGSIGRFYSNSADTGTRSLINILNDNALATGAVVLRLQQDSTGNILQAFDGATQIFTIADGGIVYINDTANTNMTIGLTINQGANDNEILALKSSDVSHAMTSITEADTYGLAVKATDTTGGLALWGFKATGSASAALRLDGATTDAADTTKSTAGHGVVVVRAMINSAGSVAAVGANGNLLSVESLNTTRFILDADGDSHQDVGTVWTEYDAYDDGALLETLNATLVHDPVKGMFRQFADENKDILSRNKIITYNDDGHHFINWSRANMLTIGAVRQLYKKLEEQALKITQLEQRLLTA